MPADSRDMVLVPRETLTVALDQAKRGADRAGCNGWRAQEMCRQIVQLLDKALTASPARGEGDAPVAWRWRWGDAEQDARWAYSERDPVIESADWVVQPLYTRPTPATPEGLREKVARMAYEWAGHDRHGGPWGDGRRPSDAPVFADCFRLADAILSALQPQAEGGSR